MSQVVTGQAPQQHVILQGPPPQVTHMIHPGAPPPQVNLEGLAEMLISLCTKDCFIDSMLDSSFQSDRP